VIYGFTVRFHFQANLSLTRLTGTTSVTRPRPSSGPWCVSTSRRGWPAPRPFSTSGKSGVKDAISVSPSKLCHTLLLSITRIKAQLYTVCSMPVVPNQGYRKEMLKVPPVIPFLWTLGLFKHLGVPPNTKITRKG